MRCRRVVCSANPPGDQLLNTGMGLPSSHSGFTERSPEIYIDHTGMHSMSMAGRLTACLSEMPKLT